MSTVQDAGWHRDPTGRHAQRYWNGRWTDFVAGTAGGPAATDPLRPGEQFPPPGQELAPAAPAPVTNVPAVPSPPPAPPPPPPPRPTAPADWYADPAARHQCRYWNGTAWTAHVADSGQTAQEPLEPAYHDAVPVPLSRATPSTGQRRPAEAATSTVTAPGPVAGTSPASAPVTAAAATSPVAGTGPVNASAGAAVTARRGLAGWDLTRWVQLAALVAMAVGVLTSWAKSSNTFLSASVNGIDTDDGKYFAILLGIVAVVVVLSELRGGSWWIAATCGGAALLIFAVYEVIHIHNESHGVVSPGVGLYLDVAGALVLTAAAATIPRFRKAP